MISLSRGFSVLYSRIPFCRNQDAIHIQPGCSHNGEDAISVVDGWNDAERMGSDQPGREAAAFVAKRYPVLFLALRGQTPALAAQEAAQQLDREFRQRYPSHVASVGAFAFCSQEQTILVSIGTIHVWTWNGKQWYKPDEIGDYFLPQPEYESGSRTFWGRGELKGNPFYALRVDTVILTPQTPLFIATDGLDDVLNLSQINEMQGEIQSSFPGFFKTVVHKALSSREQRDDITLLMRWKRGSSLR
jgi:hypothetical protein